MIRLRDTRHGNTADLFSNAVRIAEYYGFSPFDSAIMEKRRLKPVLAAKNDEIAFSRREERALAPIARRIASLLSEESPTRLLWRIANTNATPAAMTLELHVAGVPSAIAEALLIRVADTIAAESGITERALSINSIGSPESSNRFVRDIGLYLRKHLETISPTLRPRVASDPLGALVQLIERGHPAIARAPQATEYLTEEERRRFWELLEYLEASEIPYELSPYILGSRACWSHALFEITTPDQETGTRIPIAFGGRYDPLMTRFTGAYTPAAMITIISEIRGKSKMKRDIPGVPAVYFAHLGVDARRRALPLLETLRQAEIPVYQSLVYERIGDQMNEAKKLAVPFLLIMGYKEATEGTVLVREVSTNQQEAVTFDELPSYLKRHRIGAWKVEARA